MHAGAQGTFPAKPVELVVPYAAGGGTDALARSFADASRKHMDQPMIIVNKPGASGGIGMNDVINAKPDGYRLAIIATDVLTVPLLGIAKLSYRDLQPIAQLNYDPAAITVRADSPLNSLQDFVKAAKASPGSVQVGNSGTGAIWHLAAAALEDKTAVKFNHVPFQGASPAVLALLGGHIDAVAVSPAEVAPHVRAGKVKILAVMADQRVKGYEQVPTAKESGVDLSIGTWRALAAPKNTPPEVMTKLRAIAQQTAAEASFKEATAKLDLGYAYLDAEAFSANLSSDNAKFKQLIEKLQIKP
ncbi:tripartite tricarboxylate transporter substrate binding protein [Variovorax sp. J31P216]|nr:tripartite tricarboxylate transporter substrate binding protein [Variovorax sp. J31P216]